VDLPKHFCTLQYSVRATYVYLLHHRALGCVVSGDYQTSWLASSGGCGMQQNQADDTWEAHGRHL